MQKPHFKVSNIVETTFFCIEVFRFSHGVAKLSLQSKVHKRTVLPVFLRDFRSILTGR